MKCRRKDRQTGSSQRLGRGGGATKGSKHTRSFFQEDGISRNRPSMGKKTESRKQRRKTEGINVKNSVFQGRPHSYHGGRARAAPSHPF